ncbi:hypothetical protein [Virgibacillus alimentarius]|uniref:hypothetical protein n=1 Tax=Virgibacillus alimentarius TaxID=698769 RepID=UPI000A4D7E48|nr:hypothetical protein [Virgibacillus alimentarius]
MANKEKRKRRLAKTLKRRKKRVEKMRMEEAWHNVWIKIGALKPNQKYKDVNP